MGAALTHWGQPLPFSLPRDILLSTPSSVCSLTPVMSFTETTAITYCPTLSSGTEQSSPCAVHCCPDQTEHPSLCPSNHADHNSYSWDKMRPKAELKMWIKSTTLTTTLSLPFEFLCTLSRNQLHQCVHWKYYYFAQNISSFLNQGGSMLLLSTITVEEQNV